MGDLFIDNLMNSGANHERMDSHRSDTDDDDMDLDDSHILPDFSNDSETNDTTRANGTSMSTSIPFRYNYDSVNSPDDTGSGGHKMSLGDLETVKEEQTKSQYAMFVGMDSDQTTMES